MNINLEYIFPTPFWNINIESRLKEYNISLENIIEECLKIEEQDVGRSVSNVGRTSYQSNDINLFENSKSCLFKVATIIDDISKAIYTSTWQGQVEIDNAWLNINKRDGQNRVHNHQSTLSGCLYLQVPKDSGDFVVVNSPNESYIYRSYGCLHVDDNNVPIYPEHAVQELYYKPNVGDIYIFPSHLLHYVQPNKTDNKRISIAFNCIKTWK